MTVQLFLVMFTIGSLISSLFTEAIKRWFANQEKEVSANMLAAINSVVIGIIGTVIYYILKGIPFNVVNITCMILMTAAIWIASMVGYDKVMQLIDQITGGDEK